VQYTPREENPELDLEDSLLPVLKGLGMRMVEFTVFRQKSRRPREVSPDAGVRGGQKAQIRAVVCKEDPRSSMGLEDCSLVYRALLPRLELAFPGGDLSVEVSSPGIERTVRDGAELPCFIGRGIRLYRIDSSDWIGGVLRAADAERLVLEREGESLSISLELIGKVKLDPSQDL
jgi:ribosome maturation factor RimP